jgi:hypothetical protein
MSFSIVTGLNPRARHDATNASTHSAWYSSGSVASGPAGTAPPCTTRNRDEVTAHLPHTSTIKVLPNI